MNKNNNNECLEFEAKALGVPHPPTHTYYISQNYYISFTVLFRER